MPYFIFKDIDSTGVLTVNKLPSIFSAERDMELVPVQGRDGYVTNDLGSYRSVIKSVECSINDLSQLDYICNWLSGKGDVIFSNEPDKVYKAVIKNQIEFAKVLGTFHSFIILLECQPHKYVDANDVITLTTSPATINNIGTINSLPIFKIYGTGSVVLTINGRAILINSIIGSVTLDSDIGDAFSGAGNMNNNMTGEFQELIPGVNNISWTGTVSKIEVTPNFRY